MAWACRPAAGENLALVSGMLNNMGDVQLDFKVNDKAVETADDKTT